MVVTSPQPTSAACIGRHASEVRLMYEGRIADSKSIHIEDAVDDPIKVLQQQQTNVVVALSAHCRYRATHARMRSSSVPGSIMCTARAVSRAACVRRGGGRASFQ